MKKQYLHSLLIAFLFLVINGCRKTDTYHSDPLIDYMQLHIGKYITYRLDSLLFINFGTQDTVISYLAKDVVDDSVTDNLGRPSWRIIRYLSDTTGTAPWTPTEAYLVTATRETIEVVENNLRFQKLKLPITDGFSWKGNSYIETTLGFSPVAYLDGWDYTYNNVGMPYSVLAGVIPSTATVLQRDSTGDLVVSNGFPVADPGISKTIMLPVNSVQLDGSQSFDPNGFLIKFNWKQVSGPSFATIIDTNAISTTATDLEAGQYIFQLLVEDNDSSVDAAQVKIVVGDAGSILPLANAGANQTILSPVSSVTLNGTASQAPAGSIASSSWSQTSGPTQSSILNADKITTDVNNLSAGIYTFALTITDNTGTTSTDNVVVTVNAPAFSEQDYSIEVYGKGIGLIYKNFIHKEYQAANASIPVNSTSGYGITLNMIDHN